MTNRINTTLLGCALALAAPGDLDPDFGGTGQVTSDVGFDDDDSAHAVAIQPDGKIVVAGSGDDDPTVAVAPSDSPRKASEDMIWMPGNSRHWEQGR
jgi:hypothetical protein